MAKKMCTPFCDPKKACPKHHDLLLSLLNCSEKRDRNANVSFEHFQNTVRAFVSKGWNLNDDVPDPCQKCQYPLLHWVSVLGKCRLMEWMIDFGFNATVCSSATRQTALHRCVLYLHYSYRRARHLTNRINKTVHMLKDCLLLQDSAMQTPIHAAAQEMLTSNKSDYFSEWLEAMVDQAKNMPGKTALILNARDHLGNTALHYLAQNEDGFVPLHAIVNAGGDVTIVNNKNLTPLDFAMNNGLSQIIKILSFEGGKRTPSSSQYDEEIYNADSPPESPVNLQKEKEFDNAIQPFHGGNDRNPCDTSISIDAPSLGCSDESTLSAASPRSVDEDVPQGAPNAACLPITDAFSDFQNDALSGPKDAVAANPIDNVVLNDKNAPTSLVESPNFPQDIVASETVDDVLSTQTGEAGPPCHRDATSEHCHCDLTNIQMPVIHPYSCIVHIKQEKVNKCERCQQETMSEITSSSELTCDSGNSVLALLQGAGLLQNLTQIAEKARNEDERVLTDKLELVKETNSQLESGEKELAEKKNRITSLMTELEELKKQVQTTLDEKERLLLKRKHLNEECSHLQKKLHCCDSLLKVVPK